MTDTPAKQLSGFIAKFDPAVAKLVQACLPVLRRRFSTAVELVYDNYNALAIGWTPNGRTSEVIVSLAVYASGVNLYFMYGARLKDPHKLLQGSGNQGRFIRLQSASQIEERNVAALLDEATRVGKTPLATTGKRKIIIKSISAKQRPRRSTKTTAQRKTVKRPPRT